MERRSFEKQEIESRRRIIYIMVAVIVIFVLAVFGSLMFFGSGNANTDFNKRYRDYNDGWTLVQDGEMKMVDLPLKVEVQGGESIVLKKRLPSSIARYSAIATRNYHMMMRVRVDDELIYSYPGNWNERFTIISDIWSVFNVEPQNYRATLEIELKNNSRSKFSGYIRDIYFGDDNSIIQNLREEAMWGFASGFVLVIFGFFLIGISLIYSKYTNQKQNIPMGIVMMFFGFWLANRAQMPVLSGSNSRIFFLCLSALLLVPPFIFLYSYYRNEKGKKWSLRGSQVSTAIAVLLLVISLTARENVQTIIMTAYFVCFAAIINQGVLLFRSSFGEGAKFRNKTDVLLDRIEFGSTLFFPFAALFEIVNFSDHLWSEISSFYRTFILLFATMYMVTILIKIYLIVRERVQVINRLQESQLELMMGQIQPHFIFNTLSSIRTLVKVDPDIAYDMLYDFSNYLRANVDNVTNLSGINFAAEVEHIKSYVNIEKVRFGERLKVVYDIGISNFTVPPLSIQPLVENAVKHGVCQKVEGGTVTLSSYMEDGYNVVEIRDDGVGISRDAAYGLFSVYQNNENRLNFNSTEAVSEAMKSVMDELNILDENGTPIELEGPILREDHTGNGSEIHKSTGMLNIIMRLRELSNATIKIESQIGKGTDIKVYFPAEELSVEIPPPTNISQ